MYGYLLSQGYLVHPLMLRQLGDEVDRRKQDWEADDEYLKQYRLSETDWR